MVGKPTYEELEQRVKELEDEALERKGAEDALQASEENSRALSEAAFEAIFLSEKGICLGQNLAAEKMFGYTPSEAIGMTGTDWIAPDSREMVRNNMLSGYEKPYEAIALRKDGSTFPTEIQGKMICYQGREIRVTSLRDITDRVLAEEALRESEEKYRTLLDSIDEVYFEVDIAGNLTFFNDSLSKSLGYSDDELMGMNNRDYMSPESAKKIYNLFNQIYKTGTPRKKAVYEIIRKDGSRGFHELFASLMKDQAGQPIGFRGIAHDITEFKQAEQALRDSEEKFRLIAENSIDAIWQTDLNNKVTYISPSSINIGGYTPEEIMRFENALELYDDELRTLVMTEMSKLLQKPVEELKRYVIPRIQGRALHKDGHKIWVEIQAKFIFKRNMIVGVQGISRDISERKEAETALLKSEKRYRTLVDNLPIAVYRNSPGPKGEFLMANPAFCKMFGFKNEEKIKKVAPADLYSNPEERQQYSDNLIEKGVVENDERRMVKRDGTPVHTSITSRVVYGKDGDVSHFDSIMLDITDQKKLEAQLQRAQKMETIGTLAGGVAHDLNNILGGLVSYPELLLLQLPEDSPLRKSILTIQKSGEKAAAVVQDLLTLARRGVVVTEVVNPHDVISDYLRSPEHEKFLSYHPGVHIEIHLEKGILNILGSSAHLSKTAMNLVSNAAEAMLEGGKISVSMENRYIDRAIRGYDDVKEGDYVVITIADTGMGISPDDIGKIFEPFYTKKKMGRSGTGLGMAVVWGTVGS